jgi:hypothetical protein
VDNTKPRKLGGEGKNGGRLVPETACVCVDLDASTVTTLTGISDFPE